METPTAPLAAPPAEASSIAGGRRGRNAAGAGAGDRGLGAALRFAWRHAWRCWRPLLLVVLVQAVLGLTVAVPFHAALSDRLDQHAHAPALAGSPDAHDRALGVAAGLDGSLWQDVRRLDRELLQGLAIVVFWVSVLAWLFGALAAGGFLSLAAAEGPSYGPARFVAEGGRHYFRMLRVSAVFLVLTWAAGRLVFEAWAGAVGEAERAAPTSATAFWGARTREGVFVLFFLWMRVAADLARADLVVFSRRSAFLAFLRGLGRSVRHPVRTLGLALLVGGPAFAILLGLGLVSRAVTGATPAAFVALFVLVQAAVFVRWASRAALLGGLVRAVRPGPVRAR